MADSGIICGVVRSTTRRPPQAAGRARQLGWPAKAGLVGLGALVLRLLYLYELRDTVLVNVLIGDGRQYDAWAQQIAGGQWIGTEVFYQTPLYPYLVAVWFTIAGHHVFGVRVIQAVLGAASCVGLAAAGRRFFGARAGLVAGALLAIYPPAIFFDGLIQKSSLDLLLATVLLASLGECLDRPCWPWLAAAGVALGAFALNRENARLLYPIIVVWLFAYFRAAPLRRRVAWTAIVTAAAALVLLPVGLRNYYVGGEFLISTSQFGPNLYIGNHTGARGVYEPLVPGHGERPTPSSSTRAPRNSRHRRSRHRPCWARRWRRQGDSARRS
ncbi:MAG: glycosyltransferase family 39 protein [Acidobacteria bacterium]|nr:glycosyltransferase family 39 protein [Acidobacteriota bacterium]